MSRRRMAWTARALVAVLALAASATAACRSTGRQDQAATAAPANRNVRFGLPAPAAADPANRTAYLIERPEYVLSYNDTTKTPNWVSWQLTRADVGDAPRGSFEADPLLPSGFKRVTAGVYDNSGFDRGHMCNSKDRSDTPEHNDATFFMTNIVPQAPNNNQQGWEEFESYCRGLVKQGNELHIVCGPHGVGGEGKYGERDAVGKSEVSVRVPSHVWKVVLVLPTGTPPTRQTRTIAVWMPNDQSVDTNWQKYVVSVRQVEDRTGFRFFPLLDDAVARTIKAGADTGNARGSAE